MIVRKLRLQKGWSQEQLATLTGLSSRTIQRIERGQLPSLESKRALASVFEVGIQVFETPESIETSDTVNIMDTHESTITDTSKQATNKVLDDEKLALQYAKSISEFYTHLLFFVIFVPIIIVTKGLQDPQALMICGGWFLGIVFHGLVAFEKVSIFTPSWERKLVEKKLGRKL
ncbi:2TM domain-containing protein [Arenicella sp. 4NH20-0111]|uniref:helix-turn-helix domain-containing protein n=1 Tax=Arenicella sp. 4NH20-0111 TaxID=3127648 RepID=UPI00310C772B